MSGECSCEMGEEWKTHLLPSSQIYSADGNCENVPIKVQKKEEKVNFNSLVSCIIYDVRTKGHKTYNEQKIIKFNENYWKTFSLFFLLSVLGRKTHIRLCLYVCSSYPKTAPAIAAAPSHFSSSL